MDWLIGSVKFSIVSSTLAGPSVKGNRSNPKACRVGLVAAKNINSYVRNTASLDNYGYTRDGIYLRYLHLPPPCSDGFSQVTQLCSLLHILYHLPASWYNIMVMINYCCYTAPLALCSLLVSYELLCSLFQHSLVPVCKHCHCITVTMVTTPL